jgi:hypothetical protein
MKKIVLPKPEPRPMAVAVPNLIPQFAVWNSKTKTMEPVYGGNVNENSVYIRGAMPKVFRMAAEEGNYENELIFQPLPDNIEEIPLSEYPECKLLITNCKLFELPEAKPEPESCKVIEHPAAWFARAKKLHRTRNKDDNQLWLPTFEPSENFSDLTQRIA